MEKGLVMYSKYHLKADELNLKFIDSIKKLFKGKEIEIIVHDYEETEYLLESEVNRAILLESVENAQKGGNLFEVKIGELKD
jgi:antitoxin YefM